MVIKFVQKYRETRSLYNQMLFNNFFIFRLSNSQSLPREVALHDHLSKTFINTGVLINGARLVLKSSKVSQPNNTLCRPIQNEVRPYFLQGIWFFDDRCTKTENCKARGRLKQQQHHTIICKTEVKEG